MGFESFQVVLSGGRASLAETDETIRKLPHMRLDPLSILVPGSICYCMETGQHVVELELTASPVTLSCRFTLCHPDSVDKTFLGLLRVLMAGLGMEAKICDDVRPEHEHSFPLTQFEEFSAATVGYITSRRKEWINAFGPARLAASTIECYQRIILPRCQPGVLQA